MLYDNKPHVINDMCSGPAKSLIIQGPTMKKAYAKFCVDSFANSNCKTSGQVNNHKPLSKRNKILYVN